MIQLSFLRMKASGGHAISLNWEDEFRSIEGDLDFSVGMKASDLGKKKNVTVKTKG